jgi:hypothetical protein
LLRNLFAGKKISATGMILILLLFSATGTFAAENNTRIAIIPFQAVFPETESSTTVISPISGIGYFGGKIAVGAQYVVEDIFIDKLKDYKDVKIIPLDKAEGVYKRISTESLKMPLMEIMKKVGAELDADVIAVGYVFRYIERIGYHYSAEKPASVALEITFLKSTDGSLIWRGVFDKTQKSLMEDLFQIASFYRGGGKWLNAYELTKQGMDQAFKTFSGFER